MIGVFDSGSGGLTILRALKKALPGRQFTYLGDHQNAPYGALDAERIYQLSCLNVGRLMARGCRLVIVACNTVSVEALRRMQQEWLPYHYPDRRVIGIFVPMVEYLTGRIWNGGAHIHQGLSGDVALFATPFTVKIRFYANEVSRFGDSLNVREQACPALVRAIEERACPDVIEALVSTYISRLNERFGGGGPDYAILGCTHYPLVRETFRRLLPDSCDLVSQPDVVSASLVSYLQRHADLFDEAGAGRADACHLTTGNPLAVSKAVSHYLGVDVRFSAIAA